MTTDPHDKEVGQSDSDRGDQQHPTTDVTVDAHVHFGMTGSFPLRVADLFFADDGLYVVEYGYITPFIGLATRKQRREARAMQAIYDRYGLDAVIVQADSVTWHSYENVERVVVHDGGWLGRPKIAIYPQEGRSQAYRFHDRTSFEEALADLEACVDRYPLDVDHRSGLGFTPRESIKRFFWKPEQDNE